MSDGKQNDMPGEAQLPPQQPNPVLQLAFQLTTGIASGEVIGAALVYQRADGHIGWAVAGRVGAKGALAAMSQAGTVIADNEKRLLEFILANDTDGQKPN